MGAQRGFCQVPGSRGFRRQPLDGSCGTTSSRCSQELTLLVRQSRADLKPALRNLQSVVNLLLKNQSNLDESLRLQYARHRARPRSPRAGDDDERLAFVLAHAAA